MAQKPEEVKVDVEIDWTKMIDGFRAAGAHFAKIGKQFSDAAEAFEVLRKIRVDKESTSE